MVETIQLSLDARSSKSRKKSSKKGVSDDLEAFAQGLCIELLPFFSRCFVDVGSGTSLASTADFDMDEIIACFNGNDGRSAKRSKVAINPKHNLELWAANTFRLLQKAVKVYNLLDPAGKGCIVPEDVLRSIGELQITGNVSSTTSRRESATSYEDVLAMMAEFTSGSASLADKGEVVLTFHDIIKIARLVNL